MSSLFGDLRFKIIVYFMNNKVYKLFRVFHRLRLLYFKYWNRFYFYLIGVNYGQNLQVFNRIYVKGYGKIQIGNGFTFTSGDNLNPICRNIRGSLYVPFRDSKIIIGDNVGISSACLWAKERITIGNNVNIGGDCLIIDNDAHPHDYQKRRKEYMKVVGKNTYQTSIPTLPIEIEDDVWIGARCQILKGVHIGARSIIAAGSIVTKDIPSDVIAGGNPCNVIKSLK